MLMDKELKKFNLRQSDETLNISADQVPTLIPQEKMDLLLDGDSEPYYKIQEIAYPCKANGWNYLESFFESFINKLNRAPIPGSKSGHDMSWGGRPTSDLYLVGGELRKNGDGSGVVLFKNYIPPVGDNGSDNGQFIKDNKLGLIDYSLVSYTRDEITEVDGETVYNVVESIRGERNDAVEYACGAMDQKTNAREGDNKEGEEHVKKNEVLDALANFKANGDLSLAEVAKHLNLEGQLVSDKHVNALETVEKLNGILGEDPIKAASELKQSLADIEETAKENRLVEVFGAKKNSDGSENKVFNMAAILSAGKKTNEITDEFVEELKNNSIMQELAAKSADSSLQVVEESGDVKSNKVMEL